MRAVGVDVGYGNTKWAVAQATGCFDSVIAPYSIVGESWGVGTPDHPLFLDGHAVLVGDTAAAKPGALRPFADGRLADPAALPLLAAALWAAGAQGDIVLGSGMPLGVFRRERDAARQALEGRTLHIGDGVRESAVRIVRLTLRPQAIGAALWLTSRGMVPAGPGLAVFVDIGTRTTDIATIDLGSMAPVVPLSFSLEAGVATAAAALAGDVQSASGRLPPVDLCVAALQGQPRQWWGAPLPAGVEHLDALAATIAAEVQRRLGADGGRVVKVLPVGGGAVLLRGRLIGLLPGVHIGALPADQAIEANARGYLLVAEQTA